LPALELFAFEFAAFGSAVLLFEFLFAFEFSEALFGALDSVLTAFFEFLFVVEERVNVFLTGDFVELLLFLDFTGDELFPDVLFKTGRVLFTLDFSVFLFVFATVLAGFSALSRRISAFAAFIRSFALFRSSTARPNSSVAKRI
jgi:hypothetical protein